MFRGSVKGQRVKTEESIREAVNCERFNEDEEMKG